MHYVKHASLPAGTAVSGATNKYAFVFIFMHNKKTALRGLGRGFIEFTFSTGEFSSPLTSLGFRGANPRQLYRCWSPVHFFPFAWVPRCPFPRKTAHLLLYRGSMGTGESIEDGALESVARGGILGSSRIPCAQGGQVNPSGWLYNNRRARECQHFFYLFLRFFRLTRAPTWGARRCSAHHQR